MDLSDLLPAETDSADATRALGRALAAHLEPGDVIALSGDLGAGKTHLVQGVAEGLGLDGGAVTSPTFALVQEHGDGALLHLDLYRIESDAEAEPFEAAASSAMSRLDRMESQLEKAIAEEDYEAAARLRDEIARMREGN